MPGSLAFGAGLAAMGAVYAVDAAVGADVRLHGLYVFPLVLIGLHCAPRWQALTAFAVAVGLQYATLHGYGYAFKTLASSLLVAASTAALCLFLARQARDVYLQLQGNASTDALTLLRNRRAFEDVLGFELARQRRYGGRFSLAMLDLDGFKGLNDSQGHAAGDRALQLVADVLRGGTRQTDVTARLGGDEFMILLPSTSRDDAAAVCELLRERVDRSMADAGFRVTVSIGCKTFAQAPETVGAALRAADELMYEAKRRRNCCVARD